MRRRKFIALAERRSGLSACVRAQQPAAPMRRVGMLVSATAGRFGRPATRRHSEGCDELGWIVGTHRRARISLGLQRSAALSSYAAELGRARTRSSSHRQSTSRPAGGAKDSDSTIPIVFVIDDDPVGSGLFQSLARPGGNATRFTDSEFSIGGKWLNLLKAFAPGMSANFADPSIRRRPASRKLCAITKSSTSPRGAVDSLRRPQC